jgi:hypothetical protein
MRGSYLLRQKSVAARQQVVAKSRGCPPLLLAKSSKIAKIAVPIERYYACLHLLASRPKSAIEQAATLEGAGDFAKTKFRLNCWKKEDRSLHGIFYRCTAGKFYRRQISSS